MDDKVKAQAWNELYKCFGERMQQDELDLMDSILKSVGLDIQEQQFLRRFPHLASRKTDDEEL